MNDIDCCELLKKMSTDKVIISAIIWFIVENVFIEKSINSLIININ